MKLLLDINVLLDVLLQRDPWSESAAQPSWWARGGCFLRRSF